MLQIIHLALLCSWGPICNLTAAKHFIWSPCAQKTSRVYSRLAWNTCRVWHYEAVFAFPLNLFELTLNQTWPGVPTSPKSFRSQSIRIDNLVCCAGFRHKHCWRRLREDQDEGKTTSTASDISNRKMLMFIYLYVLFFLTCASLASMCG